MLFPLKLIDYEFCKTFSVSLMNSIAIEFGSVLLVKSTKTGLTSFFSCVSCSDLSVLLLTKLNFCDT